MVVEVTSQEGTVTLSGAFHKSQRLESIKRISEWGHSYWLFLLKQQFHLKNLLLLQDSQLFSHSFVTVRKPELSYLSWDLSAVYVNPCWILLKELNFVGIQLAYKLRDSTAVFFFFYSTWHLPSSASGDGLIDIVTRPDSHSSTESESWGRTCISFYFSDEMEMEVI